MTATALAQRADAEVGGSSSTHTGGSVFITIVAHATEGLIGRELTGDDGWTGADETHWVLLYTAGWCSVAIALVIFDWRLWHGRSLAKSAALRSEPRAADA